MSDGIISQYGFLFQQYVFIDTVINHASTELFFTYEGVDDIDITHDVDEGLVMVSSSKDTYIQVKSGNLTKECWSKVIGNWILTGNTKNGSFVLISENKLDFDITDENTVESVCKYFENGKAKRKKAIARKVNDILFKDNNRYKSAFEDLRRARNKVEHFYSEESVIAIKSKIDKALTATLSFITENYSEFENPSIVDMRKNEDMSLTDAEKMYIDNINRVVATLKSHHQDGLNLAHKRAISICMPDEMMICPDCKERVLVINYSGEGRCRCFFCGYENDGETVADDFLSNVLNICEYRTVKEGGCYPLYRCPECGKESFSIIENRFVCFSCRNEYGQKEIKQCEECGEMYACHLEEHDGLCDSCWNMHIEKIEKD